MLAESSRAFNLFNNLFLLADDEFFNLIMNISYELNDYGRSSGGFREYFRLMYRIYMR